MRQTIYDKTGPHGGYAQPGHEPLELRVSDAVYFRADSVYPARVTVEIAVSPGPDPARTALVGAAHDALDGGAFHVDASIDRVATRHLQERSGTTAGITDGGHTIDITTTIPTASPADTTAPAFAGGRPSLTAEQEAQLTALVGAIGSCLPAREQQHSQALALLTAQQIPTREAVLEAVNRMTLTEIIDDHEEKMEANARALLPHDDDVRREAELIQPALQAFSAVRLAQLSFPHHPATALQAPHNAAPAAAARTPSAHRPGPSLDH